MFLVGKIGKAKKEHERRKILLNKIICLLKTSLKSMSLIKDASYETAKFKIIAKRQNYISYSF